VVHGVGLGENDPNHVLDEAGDFLFSRAILDRMPAIVAKVKGGLEVLLLRLAERRKECLMSDGQRFYAD
jgi:hypothetical protein